MKWSEAEESPYSISVVEKMYSYMRERGEVFIIEIQSPEGWLPIGDIALMNDSRQ